MDVKTRLDAIDKNLINRLIANRDMNERARLLGTRTIATRDKCGFSYQDMDTKTYITPEEYEKRYYKYIRKKTTGQKYTPTHK